MNAIDPRFLSAQRWTAETAGALTPFGTVPKLIHENEWRTWANYAIGLPDVAALVPARPETFATWQAWATAFNTTVRLLAV